MPLKPELLAAIERATGETLEQIQAEPIAERRARIEATTGKPMKVTGGVEFLMSSEDVDKMLADVLRKKLR